MVPRPEVLASQDEEGKSRCRHLCGDHPSIRSRRGLTYLHDLMNGQGSHSDENRTRQRTVRRNLAQEKRAADSR
jgi:hypothetical protein